MEILSYLKSNIFFFSENLKLCRRVKVKSRKGMKNEGITLEDIFSLVLSQSSFIIIREEWGKSKASFLVRVYFSFWHCWEVIGFGLLKPSLCLLTPHDVINSFHGIRLVNFQTPTEVWCADKTLVEKTSKWWCRQWITLYSMNLNYVILEN